MAKDKPSKAQGKPPITRHPLFPATVALWFGALFGIGSLAIRTSLIESVFVALHIDAAIPSAAPPLGATTRILIALTLAALGGSLGAWLARRVARPKPVAVQRKRSASRSMTGNGEEGFASATRRGRLALNDEGARRTNYADNAPLPGSASILDVSQFDLDGFEAQPEEPVSQEEQTEVADGPVIERQNMWRREPEFERIPEGAQVFRPTEQETPPAIEPAKPEMVSGPAFVPPADSQPVRRFDEPALDGNAFAEPQDVNAVADEASVHFREETAPASEKAPFAPPAGREEIEVGFEPVDEAAADQPAPEHANTSIEEGQPLGRLEDETAPFEPMGPRIRTGSVFDRESAPGLFTKPHNAQVGRLEWDQHAVAKLAPAEDRAVLPAAAEQAEPDVQPDPEGPVATASERIVSAELDTLSHVELLERLALSMHRKREQAVMSAQTPAPEPEQAPADVPVTAEAEIAEPLSEAEKAPFASPAPPVPTIPDALRPVGLDDEDDFDLLPVSVPPRHFAQPRDDQSRIAPQVVTSFEADIPTSAASGTSPDDELEEGYSSLLSLSRPGTGIQRFVRIDEPQPATTEIEPVVVFPGQEPRSGDAPFSRPASERGDARSAETHDASEATASDGQPAAPTGRRDPEETDRALRTALANIQRMSGAA